jgi:hypothetical protein
MTHDRIIYSSKKKLSLSIRKSDIPLNRFCRGNGMKKLSIYLLKQILKHSSYSQRERLVMSQPNLYKKILHKVHQEKNRLLILIKCHFEALRENQMSDSNIRRQHQHHQHHVNEKTRRNHQKNQNFILSRTLRIKP